MTRPQSSHPFQLKARDCPSSFSALSWHSVQSHQQKKAWPRSGWTFTQSHKCLHTSVQDSGNTCGIIIFFFFYLFSHFPPHNKKNNKCWINYRAGPARWTFCAPYCLRIDCVISCRADSFIIVLDSRNLWVKFSTVPLQCLWRNRKKGPLQKKQKTKLGHFEVPLFKVLTIYLNHNFNTFSPKYTAGY